MKSPAELIADFFEIGIYTVKSLFTVPSKK